MRTVTTHGPLARSVDGVSQALRGVRDTHVTAEFVDVDHVGPARAQHHIEPVEIDAERPPAAPRNVTKLRSEGTRLADLVLVGTERPDPPHPKQLPPDAEDLDIAPIRLLVALSQDRPVRREIGQLADMPDDADALSSGSPIGLQDERPGLEERSQVLRSRRDVGVGRW